MVAGVSVGELDTLLEGKHIWLFCGHADAKQAGRTSLAFVRSSQSETVDVATLVRIVQRHASTLRCVSLNGCHSLNLAMR